MRGSADKMESMSKVSKDGSPHVTDEVFNTLTSAIGAVLALFGMLLLLKQSLVIGDMGRVMSLSIYGCSVVILFTASALHHGIDASADVEHWLRQLDYCAIFVMIAGSATPFAVILLHNRLGWVVLALVWGMAALGITLKLLIPQLPRWFTLVFYIGMGWLGMLMAKPIYTMLSREAIALFVAGGVLFTGGSIIYFIERPNPLPGRFGFHEIWHLFVLGGAGLHFVAIYNYLLYYPQ